jgi:glycosyltransferase involved in cell wall biosynthesis
MRVAWDLQAITGPERTGLGVSVAFMLHALRSHAPDINVRGLYPNASDEPLKSVWDRVYWEQWRLPRRLRAELKRGPVALLHSPSLGAPLRAAVPVIAHVQDFIPLNFPAMFRGFAGWYWKRYLPYTWRRTAALTVSNSAIRDEASAELDIAPERIHLVPYYPDPAVAELAAGFKLHLDRIDPADNPRPPVFITLASHEERKNLTLPVRALGILKRQGFQARLVLIGKHTPHTDELLELARREGVAEQVECPGYLPREETVRWLLTCTALLFTSRYEGYGLPPLEAQSVGCAVVLSDIPVHRVVYADPARWQQVAAEVREAPLAVGVDEPEELAQAMRLLAEDDAYRARLRAAGLAYAATFRAQDTAEALRTAYVAVIRDSR